MTSDEASAWLSTLRGLYRYNNCTINHEDAISVRLANLRAESYARRTAPKLFAIKEQGNVI